MSPQITAPCVRKIRNICLHYAYNDKENFMIDFSKEIRTPKKQLLVGILTRENDHIYLIVKNRGKIDRIAIEVLLSNIDLDEKTTMDINHPT